MIAQKNKKILVAPLDWGLGHATRCLPIIRYLQEQGHTVEVAAAGATAKLLQENLPQITIHYLAGYNISYAPNKRLFVFKILQQIPRILSVIKKENKWLEQLLITREFDLVISDNRYGLYSEQTKTIILTHQLQIRSGINKITDKILLYLHKKKLEKFSEVGIVDTAAYPGLALQLSHPNSLPNKSSYIGWLSQFYQPNFSPVATKPNQYLVLLSGPEPLRTQLETILWQQCLALDANNFYFVAGKIDAMPPTEIPKHIEWHSHLDAAKLATKLCESEGIICRGGYTTLMDLKYLSKPALLIPTPGQTEQEYLAFELAKFDKQFVAVTQDRVSLSQDIAKLKYINLAAPTTASHTIFKGIIDKWLIC